MGSPRGVSGGARGGLWDPLGAPLGAPPLEPPWGGLGPPWVGLGGPLGAQGILGGLGPNFGARRASKEPLGKQLFRDFRSRKRYIY